MSLNFLNIACQEKLNNSLFGLCDDNDGTKAYIDIADKRKWIATVKNDNNKDVIFTAVDKCIIHDHEYPGRGRCDAILTTVEQIYFVELKDQAKSWITDAIDQLESTINFYLENNDLSAFKHKKAFACNKRRQHFQEIDNEQNLRFFR